MFTYSGIWYFFERGLPEGWAPAAEPGPKATLFRWAGSLGSAECEEGTSGILWILGLTSPDPLLC